MRLIQTLSPNNVDVAKPRLKLNPLVKTVAVVRPRLNLVPAARTVAAAMLRSKPNPPARTAAVVRPRLQPTKNWTLLKVPLNQAAPARAPAALVPKTVAVGKHRLMLRSLREKWPRSMQRLRKQHSPRKRLPSKKRMLLRRKQRRSPHRKLQSKLR